MLTHTMFPAVNQPLKLISLQNSMKSENKIVFLCIQYRHTEAVYHCLVSRNV